MLEEDEHESLRVAIVGGGIGGLALATFLATSTSSRYKQPKVDIYESAPTLTELGAGVGIWLRTWRILEAIASGALVHDLKAVAPPGRDFSVGLRKAFEFRKGDLSPEGKSFYTMKVPFGVLTLHRADFQRILAQHAIPPAKPHFGKRIIGYEYADENDLESEIVLRFSDGSTARTDVLVGADGIRSVVRREVIRRFVKRGVLALVPCPNSTIGNDGDDIQNPDQGALISDLVEPVWSGTIVYRNLIPLEKIEERFPNHRAGRGPVVYFGKNQHVIAFPIASAGGSAAASDSNSSVKVDSTQSQMVNLVAFVSDPAREGTRLPAGEPWVRPATKEEVLEKFGGWEDEVLALLELAEKPLAWAIHTVKSLPRYSDADGRVALLGDAAHAMSPHQGAGGGQAIEDAYVLASLLTHPRLTRRNIANALKAYDAIRVPISQRVMESSRANGMMYEFNLGWDEGADLRRESQNGDVDEEMNRLRNLADSIMQIHRWEWEEFESGRDSGESQRKSAIRTFEDSLSDKFVFLNGDPRHCRKREG
ncbi:hypothetical protein ACEPAF_8704 [Sanghuangporus sanghuang]